MAGIDPVTMMAINAAVGVVAAKKQASAANKQARAQAEYQNRLLQMQQAAKERDAKSALQKAQATQRARFGASGIGRGGSADALLQGMEIQTNRDLFDSRFKTSLGISQNNNSLNLLERRNSNKVKQTIYNQGINLLEK